MSIAFIILIHERLPNERVDSDVSLASSVGIEPDSCWFSVHLYDKNRSNFELNYQHNHLQLDKTMFLTHLAIGL